MRKINKIVMHAEKQEGMDDKIMGHVDETIECVCKKIQDESASNITNKSQLSEMTAALAALITASVMLKREAYTSRMRRLPD